MADCAFPRASTEHFASSEVPAMIPYGVRLRAEARDSGTDRIRVTYNGQTGWISILYFEALAGNLANLLIEQE